MASSTYKVRHKKTGRSVSVDDAFKKTCDESGYDHIPKIQQSGWVTWDKKGRVLGPDGKPVK